MSDPEWWTEPSVLSWLFWLLCCFRDVWSWVTNWTMLLSSLGLGWRGLASVSTSTTVSGCSSGMITRDGCTCPTQLAAVKWNSTAPVTGTKGKHCATYTVCFLDSLWVLVLSGGHLLVVFLSDSDLLVWAQAEQWDTHGWYMMCGRQTWQMCVTDVINDVMRGRHDVRYVRDMMDVVLCGRHEGPGA